MKKTTKDPEGIRVEIHLRGWKTTEQDCEGAIEQIKRHVDNVSSTEIIYDITHFCEFCCWGWGTDVSYYNGGCCHEDLENQPKCHADYDLLHDKGDF